VEVAGRCALVAAVDGVPPCPDPLLCCLFAGRQTHHARPTFPSNPRDAALLAAQDGDLPRARQHYADLAKALEVTSAWTRL
jgi:hypothetical protein